MTGSTRATARLTCCGTASIAIDSWGSVTCPIVALGVDAMQQRSIRFLQ
jgi:hypothetical protein